MKNNNFNIVNIKILFGLFELSTYWRSSAVAFTHESQSIETILIREWQFGRVSASARAHLREIVSLISSRQHTLYYNAHYEILLI